LCPSIFVITSDSSSPASIAGEFADICVISVVGTVFEKNIKKKTMQAKIVLNKAPATSIKTF